MPTTTNLALPYPELTDAPNGPAAVQALAQAIDALSGPWTSYAPTWTASTTNPTFGDTTVTGAWLRAGRTIHFRLKFLLNASFNQGVGFYSIGLPVAAAAAAVDQPVLFRFFDLSTPRHYIGLGDISGAVISRVRFAADVTFAASAPVVLATGDFWTAAGTYEAAA